MIHTSPGEFAEFTYFLAQKRSLVGDRLLALSGLLRLVRKCSLDFAPQAVYTGMHRRCLLELVWHGHQRLSRYLAPQNRNTFFIYILQTSHVVIYLFCCCFLFVAKKLSRVTNLEQISLRGRKTSFSFFSD